MTRFGASVQRTRTTLYRRSTNTLRTRFTNRISRDITNQTFRRFKRHQFTRLRTLNSRQRTRFVTGIIRSMIRRSTRTLNDRNVRRQHMIRTNRNFTLTFKHYNRRLRRRGRRTWPLGPLTLTSLLGRLHNFLAHNATRLGTLHHLTGRALRLTRFERRVTRLRRHLAVRLRRRITSNGRLTFTRITSPIIKRSQPSRHSIPHLRRAGMVTHRRTTTTLTSRIGFRFKVVVPTHRVGQVIILVPTGTILQLIRSRFRHH